VRVLEIRRYPIKSVLGEQLRSADIDGRGLVGDRLWAVRDHDGKFGSGKNTRRFRRMPGLFDLRGHGDGPVPRIDLPDGCTYAADDPEAHAAVSRHLGRDVTVEREADVLHHDEGPVSVITTAGLRHLSALIGEPVDPLRFRANLLIDVPGTGFPEDAWIGQQLSIGRDVVLTPMRGLTRCVMIDLAQEEVPDDGRLLKTISEHHDMVFGLWARVERPGVVTVHDAVVVDPAG
jgi:uncharacterized protein